MKKTNKRGWYLSFLFGTILTAILFFARGGMEQTEPEALYQILSDAFFVPGIMLTGIGILVLVAEGGVFDMIRYGVTRVFRLHKSDDENEPHTYFEYRKKQMERPRAPTGFLFFSGIVFLLLATLFLILYFRSA